MSASTRLVSLAAITLSAAIAAPSSASAQQTGATRSPMQAALLAQAKITPEAATRSALALVPNGTVQSMEMDREDGRVVYEFRIVAPGRGGYEKVEIDAVTGQLHEYKHKESKAEKRARKHGLQ